MRPFPSALLLLALAASPRPAGAFDSAPWDGAAFDAPATMRAATRARIAMVLAASQARRGEAGRSRARDHATTGSSGCTVNIGGVTLAPGASPSSLSVVTSATVRDVITVCR